MVAEKLRASAEVPSNDSPIAAVALTCSIVSPVSFHLIKTLWARGTLFTFEQVIVTTSRGSRDSAPLLADPGRHLRRLKAWAPKLGCTHHPLQREHHSGRSEPS